MSKELQPPVPISLVKIELPTVIKNEPLESEIVEIGIDDIQDILDSSESEEEIIPDVKDIDIVYRPVYDESIKSEILETKHCESVETQVLIKAENSLFIQADNITQRNMTGDASDENVIKGTGQEVVEIQDLNGISTRTRKAKQPKKINFAKCHKTVETTLWEKDKEKINVIKAHVIPVQAHEYTFLAEDKYVCNHCQHASNKLNNLKLHIRKMHREVTTMYQCPYCSYKSKWNLQKHIIQKHKDTKDIQWFKCNICEMKFKIKSILTQHMKVHLRHKQMKDGLDLSEKRYHCNKCSYRTDKNSDLKSHKLTHLKPEEIQYFYCYHCSHKNKHKQGLKKHIFRQHFKIVKQEKRVHCNKCNYKTYTNKQLKNHEIIHLKPEEIEYFYCYHCSYKSKQKGDLNVHIFRHHFKNVKKGKRHHCDKCDYKTYYSTNFKSHKLSHLNPEEIHYFYCYHCSYKAKQKGHLKEHIFRHFKKGQIKFDCYICNFMTPERESIIKHIKKHSKFQNKFEIN